MATATIRPQSYSAELGEGLAVSDPVHVYDDANVAKIEKCISNAENFVTFQRPSYMQACKVDTNKYVAIYRDALNSSRVYLQAFSFDASDVITKGTPYLVYATYSYYMDICLLDTNKFLISYRLSTGVGVVQAGTCTGLVINPPGSTLQYSVGSMGYSTLTQLDTDKAMVAFRDGGVSNAGIIKAFTVSALNITQGLGHNISAVSTTYLGSCSRGINKFCVAYSAGSKGRIRDIVCASGTGTTFTVGTESEFNGGYIYSAWPCEIAPNKVAVVFRDGSDGNKANLVIAELTGSTFGTWGTKKNIVNGMSYYQGIRKLEDNKFIIIATCETQPYELHVVKLTASGTTAVTDSDEILSNDRSSYVEILVYATDRYAALWMDNGSANIGKTIVITGVLNTISNCIGLLGKAGVTGDVRQVDLPGVIHKGITGLSIGAKYYVQGDGSISRVESPYCIAIALDTDKLLIRGV